MPEHVKTPAGSPAAGEPAFLAIGRIRRPHGVKGDVLIDVLTDHPERITPGIDVYAGVGHFHLVISRCRHHKDGLLVAFEGIDTPEDVGRFRNQFLSIKAIDLPELPEGEFYYHQMVGLTVFTDEGLVLGIIKEILSTGANDVLLILNNEKEYLIPAIPDVILSVDQKSRTMKVHLIPGLLDL